MILAMWSGPRNLSTTMMYSFGARKDFSIWDEPYYAAYLNMTGLEHPMRKEILAQGILNPEEVRSACVGKIPNGKSNYFQKHQTQHMLPSFDRKWIKDVTNVFLIRHPARVISSYEKKRENPTLEDLGFKLQYEIFDYVCQKTGKKPPVVDSYLVRKNPEKELRLLCSKIDLKFDSRMLKWPSGGHINDGVWAPHWYNSVWSSTGFMHSEESLPVLSKKMQLLCDDSLVFYEKMKL